MIRKTREVLDFACPYRRSIVYSIWGTLIGCPSFIKSIKDTSVSTISTIIIIIITVIISNITNIITIGKAIYINF